MPLVLSMDSLPERTYPSHLSVKEHADNRPVILFVTVCAAIRRHPHAPALTAPPMPRFILDAWRQADAWLVGRYVIMPDHIHFFCSPATCPRVPFRRWMGYWKRLVTQNRPPSIAEKPPSVFQRDQWDTQLRTGDNYDEKWAYVRANPVRKGWVSHPDDWPWQGELNVLPWSAP
jgi:REP element-mobilizing transposase RayT